MCNQESTLKVGWRIATRVARIHTAKMSIRPRFSSFLGDNCFCLLGVLAPIHFHVLPAMSGIHFRVPWLQWPIIYDIRARPRKISSPTGSKDLQMVNISLRVLSRPDQTFLPQVMVSLSPHSYESCNNIAFTKRRPENSNIQWCLLRIAHTYPLPYWQTKCLQVTILSAYLISIGRTGLHHLVYTIYLTKAIIKDYKCTGGSIDTNNID